MNSNVTEVAANVYRISTFHPDYQIQFNQPYTDQTMQRLADLKPRTLALMHGSTFRGDGRSAILDLAGVIRETHGRESG